MIQTFVIPPEATDAQMSQQPLHSRLAI